MTPRRWQTTDPWQGLVLMTTPTWNPAISFRFRNDDGSEAAATWKASQNAAIEQRIDENFRLRVESQMTNAGDTTSVTWTLQFRVNEGTWTDVSTSTAVRLASSSQVSNGTSTTNQLTAGSGTFVAGRVMTTANTTPSISMTSSSHTENEWCLTLHGPSLDQSDSVEFRVLVSGVEHAATTTPSLTVQALAPALAPTLLSPANAAGHDGELFTWQFNTDNAPEVTGQAAFAFRRRDPGEASFKTEPVADTAVIPQSINDFAFSPDGTLLAIARSALSGTSNLLVLSTSDWAALASQPALVSDTVSGLTFTPDGVYLILASNTSPFWRIFATSNWGEVTGLSALETSSNSVTVSSNGALLALTHSFGSGKYLTIIDTSNWSIVSGTPTMPNFSYQARFSHDNSKLAVVGDTYGLRVFNVSDWSVVSGTPTLPGSGRAVRWTSDDGILVVGHVNAPRMTAYDTTTWNKVSGDAETTGTVLRLALTSNNRYLAVGHSTDPWLTYFDTETWGAITAPTVFGSSGRVAIRPDDTFLAFGGSLGDNRFAVFEDGMRTRWWNGTDWQDTEVFIESSNEFLELPPGAWHVEAGVVAEGAGQVVAEGALTGTGAAEAVPAASGAGEVRAEGTLTGAGLAPVEVDGVVGATAAGPTDANTLAVDVPAGVQEGDDLLLFSATPVELDTATAPAGWTLIANINPSSTTTVRTKVWHRVAGASEPADYTIDQTGKAGSTYHAAQMVALRGGTLGKVTVGTATGFDGTPVRARQTTYLHYAGLSLVYCGWRTISGSGDTVTAPAELTNLSTVNTRTFGDVPFMWIGYEGNLDFGDADRDFTAPENRRGRVGIQIAYYDGDALTDVTARPTIEVNEAWNFATPALPTGWQDGDLHLLLAAQQAATAMTCDGYALIGKVSGGSSNGMEVWARYLRTGDTAPTLAGGTELMAWSLLLRNARLLLDDPAEATFDSDTGGSGSLPADTFTGNGIGIIAASEFSGTIGGDPVFTSDDTYTPRTFYLLSGFTRLRGFDADLVDGAAAVTYTHAGTQPSLLRIIAVGAEEPS